MDRVYNFAAGPSALPLEVLKKAQSELLNYKGTGMSVMEMSHRSKAFAEIIEGAESLLREIMEIPANYSVLFLQGGGSTQFAMIPLNLFSEKKKADYIVTGVWAKKAAAEAARYGTVNIVASSQDKNFSYIPEVTSFSSDADYVYITRNNTIYGTRYTYVPKTGNIPLVADMSSNILSEKFKVSDYGLIFAGAQKNLAPAGVTIVIIRNDLIKEPMDITPTMLKYKTHAEAKSLFNTPPCFSIYMLKLVLEYVKDLGGIEYLQKKNEEKSFLLYDFLDTSNFYKGTAREKDRSLMNVPFVLKKEELNEKFLAEAKAEGLAELKGHRSVGGMRASIYNAMPYEGVKKLVGFMDKFAKENK